MDPVIAAYPCEPLTEGVMWCPQHGVAYQADTNELVSYDADYFNNYVRLESGEIGLKLNEFRTSITSKYVHTLLDIGIGSGQFIKSSSIKVFGYDINPFGVAWLKERNLYVDPYAELPAEVEGISLWDTLEHIPDPSQLFQVIRKGMYLFVSIPIFPDLQKLTKSKHFKPNEHVLYFTQEGLVKYMTASGFTLLETSDEETKAGRESIMSFVFQKD